MSVVGSEISKVTGAGLHCVSKAFLISLQFTLNESHRMEDIN